MPREFPTMSGPSPGRGGETVDDRFPFSAPTPGRAPVFLEEPGVSGVQGDDGDSVTSPCAPSTPGYPGSRPFCRAQPSGRAPVMGSGSIESGWELGWEAGIGLTRPQGQFLDGSGQVLQVLVPFPSRRSARDPYRCRRSPRIPRRRALGLPGTQGRHRQSVELGKDLDR
jgi:hypothetical protein